MHYWTELSVQLANQRNYLDLLFRVYPMCLNIRREISENKWARVTAAFEEQDNSNLIRELLSLELFPIKDSYVAYLKRDASAITRNPETVNRLAGTLYEMGLNKIYENCTKPKETNRQIGPLFKRWISSGALGAPVFTTIEDFLCHAGNAVLNTSDAEMERFAREYLGYAHEKGLDFVAKFNNTFVIGEAKFLTDFGGHQAAQFSDAISTITSELQPNRLQAEVIKIAICDGVLYIPGNHKMYRHLREHDDQIVLSSLLLREFLYSI